MADNINDDDLLTYTTGDILSQEVKKIRLRISDCYRSEILEPIFLKMWRTMLHI
jgi:hypothetical protein